MYSPEINRSETVRRFVRSIVPRITQESFDAFEAHKRVRRSYQHRASQQPLSESTKNTTMNTADAQKVAEETKPSTRKRSGRRVTRVAGAAGESVKLTVAQTSGTRAVQPVDKVDKQDKQTVPPVESSTTINAAGNSASTLQGKRPITALLFQEPVWPTHSSDRVQTYDNESHELREPRNRNNRDYSRRQSQPYDDDVLDNTRNNNSNDNDRERRADSAERADRNDRNRRNKRADRNSQSNAHLEDLERTAGTSRPTDVNDASSSRQSDDSRELVTRRNRKNRRLNAVERRAAAEVEQIEEDLEYDDIVYAPIDDRSDEAIDLDEIISFDDMRLPRGARRSTREREDEIIDNNEETQQEDEEEPTQTYTRRRRRRSHANTAQEQDVQASNESAEQAKPQDDDHDDALSEAADSLADEEETVYTRRRRRRRNKNNDDADSNAPSNDSDANALQNTPRRSRKQQYIDEITDIEGSTRLEAKRQRRRDNRRERRRQNLLMEQDFLARRENVERLMVVRERDRHTQISVIEDNILVEHYVSDIQEVATVGNIYLGRVQNVLPSMEAAFVDIGQARNGVLYAGEVNWDTTRLEGQPRRMELAFKVGDPVLVQVTKDPIGHKGARLTSQVTLAGRFLVLVPSGGMTGVSRKLSDSERSRLRSIVNKIAPKEMGVIIRTAADGASEENIAKDLQALLQQWERVEQKHQEFLHGKRAKLLQGEPDVAIRVVRDIFNDDFKQLIVEGEGVYNRINEYLEVMAPDLRSKLEYWDPAEHEGKDVFDKWQIDSQLRKGMERQVYLPAGGSIVIDRTEAMTTIDVNTGRFIGRGKSLEETVTRCNLEASEEIARQLRLRDIGGMVMIDYVDMVLPSNRDLVLRRLVECLARDRTKHQVAEVTSLGLVQMTRKRVGQGLVEAFSEECPTCKGRGFILHDEPTVSAEYADPYALKGGDPFVKTNKYGHGVTETQVKAQQQRGSSADVRAKLARIAAATVATEDNDQHADAKADAQVDTQVDSQEPVTQTVSVDTSVTRSKEGEIPPKGIDDKAEPSSKQTNESAPTQPAQDEAVDNEALAVIETLLPHAEVQTTNVHNIAMVPNVDALEQDIVAAAKQIAADDLHDSANTDVEPTNQASNVSGSTESEETADSEETIGVEASSQSTRDDVDVAQSTDESQEESGE